jgi:hypothetical protein
MQRTQRKQERFQEQFHICHPIGDRDVGGIHLHQQMLNSLRNLPHIAHRQILNLLLKPLRIKGIITTSECRSIWKEIGIIGLAHLISPYFLFDEGAAGVI